MYWTSPWWLVALIPWLALTVWLLWGLHQRTPVPFLPLWPRPEALPPTRRRLRPPPLAVAALLAAGLLGILAAAGPVVRGGVRPGPAIHIVLDRGVIMSASEGQRYLQTIAAAETVLLKALGDGPVDLVLVPGHEVRTARRTWAQVAGQSAPTAVATAAALEAAVARCLAHSHDAVVLVSDQPVTVADDRMVRLGPSQPAANVRIAAVSVWLGQVMVSVENHSSLTRATLVISSDGGETTRRELDLPLPGESADYFIDLPRPGMVVEARLDVADDVAADNCFPVVRQWPALVLRGPVPEELARMVQTYAALRPSAGSMRPIVITSDSQELAADEPAVILAPFTAAPGALPVVADHPITAHVGRWPACGGEETAGWETLVRVGGRQLLGIRPGPPRRAIVAADLAAWAREPDFVVFWSNLFDWLADTSARYQSRPAGPLPGTFKPDVSRPGVETGLWPGIYRHDQAVCAVHAGTGAGFAPPTADAAARLAQLRQAGPTGAAGRPTAPWLLLAAVALVLAAAAVWKRE